MEALLARQPIFERDNKIFGYELIYSNIDEELIEHSKDENRKASDLIFNALSVFGIDTLSDSKPALISFDTKAIMQDSALIFQPSHVFIEVFKDSFSDIEFVKRIAYLKSRGYKIAINICSIFEKLDIIVPFCDVIRVDFQRASEKDKRDIVQKLKAAGKLLLAKNVESYSEREKALAWGYDYIQGPFFTKALVNKNKKTGISAGICMKILKEIESEQPRFSYIAQLIQSDVVLTYTLLQTMNSVRFYRGFKVTTVLNALARMGTVDLRAWTLIMLAKESNNGKSDEIVKMAYVRGIFMQRIAEIYGLHKRSDEAFLLGIFSFMDIIMETPMSTILSQISFSKDINDVLLNKGHNKFKEVLNFVKQYESCEKSNENLNEENFGLSDDEVLSIYAQCLFNADMLFRELLDKRID